MRKPGRAALGIFVSLAGSALAQTPASVPYPAKPVRVLVGFAPGGGIDIAARLYAQRLTARRALRNSVRFSARSTGVAPV